MVIALIDIKKRELHQNYLKQREKHETFSRNNDELPTEAMEYNNNKKIEKNESVFNTSQKNYDEQDSNELYNAEKAKGEDDIVKARY